MDFTTAEDAADRLIEHRRASARAGTPVTHTLRPAAEVLSAALAPTNAADAYAIQDALIRRLGPVAGWKVGARGEDTPACAPVWASVLHREADAPVFASAEVDYECEIAYTFARALPAAGAPYDTAAVLAAIGGTQVSMELLAPRFSPPRERGEPLVMLADGLHCGALVIGARVPGYVAVDCTTQRVQVQVNGNTVIDHAGGTTGPALAPLLVWLANHLAARGLGLQAGDVVTTGSWMGKRAALAEGEVCVRFEGFGEMRVGFGA